MLIYNCPKDRKVVFKMNREDFRMDYEERKEFVIEKIAEILQNNSEAFVEACEQLDNWNGFLGDARCNAMWEVDEFFTKPSELLDKMDDFDPSDEYFYFTAYGNVSTTSDVYDVYSDEHDVDEVIDELIDNYSHVDLTVNDSLKELLEVVYRDDFGIEEDWEYDEDMDECDMPEETDDEFMDRINDIV